MKVGLVKQKGRGIQRARGQRFKGLVSAPGYQVVQFDISKCCVLRDIGGGDSENMQVEEVAQGKR